ncbi:hypothetical protein D0812_20800 [Vibrio owensii]|uniref:Uncharacterized protein n=1 Tax=Vibrio owensii TaxID=696485 RepID=A0AAP9KBX0_9VIBR|nr:hypothetical protein [Vibrio owensii]AYO16837.1 hypothetical protein D0812_20800 [Vibrio owensii]QGH49002.1 hypothetical protein APZ19_17855 [Vibrio owensii]
MTYEFTGFHGTDAGNVSNIQKYNFAESRNDDEWLGYGVYFFTGGISCPEGNAIEWAKNQAFNKDTRSYDYEEFAVLKVKANVNSVLDTTTMEGLTAFNQLRDALIEKHDSYFKMNRNVFCDDRFMWNLVSQTMKLDAIIHNLYIKDKTQRLKKIRSNVPNTTVLCVKVADSIDINSIEVVNEGRVV